MRRGSSFVELEGPKSSTDVILDELQSKVLSVPDTVSARDMGTGRAVTMDSDVPIAIIAAVAVGGVVLLVLTIIIICMCRKRCKQNKSHDKPYVAVATSSTGRSDSAPTHTHIPAYVPMQLVQPKVIRLVCMYPVIDAGEGILNLQAGMSAVCDPQDWVTTSEWVWVTSGTRAGYVPRNFVRIV